MDRTQLGEIGQAFLAVVEERWPEFLESARAGVDGDLEIRHPSPHPPNGPGAGSGGSKLFVLADVHLDEMIVGFGGGHSRRAPWREPGDVDHGFQNSIRFIQAILDEEVVGYAREDGARGVADLDWLKRSDQWVHVTRLSSWRGTHDWERGGQKDRP